MKSVDAAQAVVLTGHLAPDDVARVAAGAPVELDPGALAAVRANRAVLEHLIATGTPVYGTTTGFGALVDAPVPVAMQKGLQTNLLRSHAAGTGPDLSREVVRAALAVRLNGLLLAHSGIRPVLLERIAALVNADLIPCVPRSGSLGASGDLAPSAHAFLPLIGEGEVTDSAGATLTGSEALERLGLEPLELEAKEGLALINGTHFMTGIGALLAVRVRHLLDSADGAVALTLDALRGAAGAFDPRVHALRPLAGQARSAANVAAMLDGSTRTRVNGASGRLQDAYSLRCAAQVHGAAREAGAFFERLVQVDLDAATDNPLVFTDPPEVVSAGNFHGQSLALAFDTLRIALADLASVSERRIFRLVSPSLNGDLPAFLSPTAGASSGYMIVQYSAAALVAELRALAHPVSVDSIPTSDDQEDHVSMGMTSAVMAIDSVDRAETVLAAEVLCACQALDCDPGGAGAGTLAVHHALREWVPSLTDDRPPARDLEATVAMLRDGVVADAVEAAARTPAGIPA